MDMQFAPDRRGCVPADLHIRRHVRGGVVRWLGRAPRRGAERTIAELESGPGVLFSSRLIAGGALARRGDRRRGRRAGCGRADAATGPGADYLATFAGLQGPRWGRSRSTISWLLAAFRLLAAFCIAWRRADRCPRHGVILPFDPRGSSTAPWCWES